MLVHFSRFELLKMVRYMKIFHETVHENSFMKLPLILFSHTVSWKSFRSGILSNLLNFSYLHSATFLFSCTVCEASAYNLHKCLSREMLGFFSRLKANGSTSTYITTMRGKLPQRFYVILHQPDHAKYSSHTSTPIHEPCNSHFPLSKITKVPVLNIFLSPQHLYSSGLLFTS